MRGTRTGKIRLWHWVPVDIVGATRVEYKCVHFHSDDGDNGGDHDDHGDGDDQGDDHDHGDEICAVPNELATTIATTTTTTTTTTATKYKQFQTPWLRQWRW